MAFRYPSSLEEQIRNRREREKLRPNPPCASINIPFPFIEIPKLLTRDYAYQTILDSARNLVKPLLDNLKDLECITNFVAGEDEIQYQLGAKWYTWYPEVFRWNNNAVDMHIIYKIISFIELGDKYNRKFILFNQRDKPFKLTFIELEEYAKLDLRTQSTIGGIGEYQYKIRYDDYVEYWESLRNTQVWNYEDGKYILSGGAKFLLGHYPVVSCRSCHCKQEVKSEFWELIMQRTTGTPYLFEANCVKCNTTIGVTIAFDSNNRVVNWSSNNCDFIELTTISKIEEQQPIGMLRAFLDAITDPKMKMGDGRFKLAKIMSDEEDFFLKAFLPYVQMRTDMNIIPISRWTSVIHGMNKESGYLGYNNRLYLQFFRNLAEKERIQINKILIDMKKFPERRYFNRYFKWFLTKTWENGINLLEFFHTVLNHSSIFFTEKEITSVLKATEKKLGYEPEKKPLISAWNFLKKIANWQALQ